MTARMFKDGMRMVPPVLMAPFEIVVAGENLPQQVVKVEYDEEGLHFLTNWGMCGISKEQIGEGKIVEESKTALPPMHD